MADSPNSTLVQPQPPETIPPRSGEELDTAAVAGFLEGKLPRAEGPLEITQFGGGHANLTYCLCFGRGRSRIEYVLRRPPLGPVAPGSHDMGREFRALSVLYQAFPYAPRAYVYCDDPSVIGAPFFVMERRRGLVVRGAIPECFGGGREPDANRKLSQVVIDVLAELHHVDPVPIGLDKLGRDPARFLTRQVAGWTDRFERAKTGEISVAEETSRWLLDHLPASPAPTIIHNDWRLDNMAVAADDPGRCVAVYDWDMCTIGDPLCDLGTLLSQWANAGEGAAGFSPMPSTLPGFLTREQAASRYAEHSGRSVDDVAYYLVFGTFKMAVVLQQIYFRYARGQTGDERFAGMGRAAEQLFQLAGARRP
jgi:aminoglycoside phosphotransferase (APT) family kinase protein